MQNDEAGISRGAVGTIAWTERTGGVLTRPERLALVPSLLGGVGDMVVGPVATALRVNSGRRASLDPAVLVPPDSALARAAEVAAGDLLPPFLLNHSSRAYAWGAALGALDGVRFDREILYLAALFHDVGLTDPEAGRDFTTRSATAARAFLDQHGFSAADREVVTNAIALHHTPGVQQEDGPEAYLMSSGAAVDVFGLRAHQLPTDVRSTVADAHPRLGFKKQFTRLWRAESKAVPGGRAQFLRRYALSDLTIRLAPFRG
ncbi:HD domain-containing protein [Nocardioides stalactiti]|uniref:HD domain-containing protein n=1 Tax=Nocardioides stalactiti TaxID=2755356 RepID=UPI0015FEEA4D|nr:HD domain-containing protein [Nocardioides stalactiti]